MILRGLAPLLQVWDMPTTLYFGCPDVDAAHAELRARGGAVDPPARTGYGFRAIVLADPDGHGVCLHRPAGDGA